MDIAPKEALIRRNNVEQMINVSKIEVGDIMIIKPGQKIAMDGQVIKGHSSVNQAAITGESVPIEKILMMISLQERLMKKVHLKSKLQSM